MDFEHALNSIMAEINDVAGSVDVHQAEVLAASVNAAARVFLAGEGRSGFVARSFAMRLTHLGMRAFVVGESTTPAAGKGDVVLVVSGSGETPVVLHFAEAARSAGATVAAVLADTGSHLAELADTSLVIPGKVKTGIGHESVQMPGSLFEQAAFIVLDAVVMQLARIRGESIAAMRARHTTLE